MEKEKVVWGNRKLFSFKDPEISTTLNLNCSANYNYNYDTFSNPILCISITDGRVETLSTTIRINLDFDDLDKFVDLANHTFNNGSGGRFTEGKKLDYVKHEYKARKDLSMIMITHNGEKRIQISLADSAIGKKSYVMMDALNFKSLMFRLEKFREHYHIETNNSILLLNTIVFKEQTIITHKLIENLIEETKKNRSIIPKIFNSSMQSNNSGGPETEIDIDNDPINNSNVDLSLNREFENVMLERRGFDDVILDIPQDVMNNTIIKTENNITIPLFGDLLEWNPNRLFEWKTSFVCLTGKSEENLFAPLDIILRLTSIPENELNIFRSHENYYNMQYISLLLLKRYVKEGLQGKTSPRIPQFKLNTIEYNTKIYELGKSVCALIILYSIFNNFLKNLSLDYGNARVYEYFTTTIFLKLCLGTLVFSIKIDDRDKFVEELCILFDKMSENGFLEKFKEDYKSFSAGGKLGIDREMFFGTAKRFVNLLVNNVDEVSNFDEYFTQYGIEKINATSSSDIKEKLMNDNENNEKDSVKKVVKTEKDKKNIPIGSTEKLLLFLDCIKDNVEDDVFGQIKDYCECISNYDDIPALLNNTKFPDIVYSIKKLIDLNPGLNTKNDILNSLEKITEIKQNEEILNEFGIDSDFDNFSAMDTIDKLF